MDIHRADPVYRNRALLLLSLTTLCCAVALLILHAWLQRIGAQLMSSDPETLRRWLRALFVGLGLGMAIPAALLGATLRRLGRQARDEGRFPPQDWKTMRDVRILRDATALRWAGITEWLGYAAIGLAALLTVWALWAFWRYR
jgi:hypothetical protein